MIRRPIVSAIWGFVLSGWHFSSFTLLRFGKFFKSSLRIWLSDRFAEIAGRSEADSDFEQIGNMIERDNLAARSEKNRLRWRKIFFARIRFIGAMIDLFVHLTRKRVLVIEDDKHYSPARIAGLDASTTSLAEGEPQARRNCSSPSATEHL